MVPDLVAAAQPEYSPAADIPTDVAAADGVLSVGEDLASAEAEAEAAAAAEAAAEAELPGQEIVSRAEASASNGVASSHATMNLVGSSGYPTAPEASPSSTM